MFSGSVRWLSAIPFGLALSCGGGSNSTPGSGGAHDAGGRSSGGTASVAGAAGAGETPSNGGAPVVAGTAGQSSMSSGGATAGGSGALGGSVGGGGVSAQGGTANAGGSAGTPSGAGGTSPGCGSAITSSTCSKSGTKCSVDVTGAARTYYLQLPSNYSSSKPYPVVFQFHPLGGSAEQALNMYRISTGLPEAIYVTPQGLVGNDNNAGWANANGGDIAFTKALLSSVQASFCVDNSRIFSTGFSYGGMMSFAIGCEMSDVFRAIAPMSGALYSDPSCKGTGHAVATWGAHGSRDTFVPTADGRAARDKILKQNHCGTQTVPIDPSPCVSYQGCDDGYPVTWCEWDGEHAIPSFGSSAIAAFFKQF